MNFKFPKYWEDILNFKAREPGFFGRIPYIFILRVLVTFSLIARFSVHYSEYKDDYLNLMVILVSISIVLALASLYVTFFNPRLRRSVKVQAGFIIFDCIFISIAYGLTHKLDSDYFWLYYLPAISAAEFLNFKPVLLIYLFIVLAFVVVACWVFKLGYDLNVPDYQSLFLKVLLPRGGFLVLILFPFSFLIRQERIERDRISKQEEEKNLLLNFKSQVEHWFDIKDILECTARMSRDMTKGDRSIVSLVNYNIGVSEVKMLEPKQELTNEELVVNKILSVYPFKPGETVNVKNGKNDARIANIASMHCVSVLCVPIIAHETIYGTILVCSKNERAFSQETAKSLAALAQSAASAIQRARLLMSLQEIDSATTGSLDLDSALDNILQELTDNLSFEFATVSLVDDYLRTIETIKAKNVQVGWKLKSKHGLDSPDIQADIIRTGKTEIIEGWDERFDIEIYERFGHKDMVRIFAPIIAEKQVIGVIEAGCRIPRRSEIFTEKNIQAVEQLARESGKTLEQKRRHLYGLFELIAERSLEIIGADGASVHIYQGDREVSHSGAGKADREFLSRVAPRKKGIGRQAMEEGKEQVINNPNEIKEKNARLYEEGVKALAAFPLSLAKGTQGVVYLHFQREHAFSIAELELERRLIKQAEVAIGNNLTVRNLVEVADMAWALSGLQQVIQSLSSESDLYATLDQITENMLYMLDADIVILGQYDQSRQQFLSPLIRKGRAYYPAEMPDKFSESSKAWKIIKTTEHRFDSYDEISLEDWKKENPSMSAPFVVRESIRSRVSAVLRAGELNEIVGVLFVNYRTPRDFIPEEKKIIRALASSAAIAIYTARLRGRRDQELRALVMIGQHLATSVDLQQFLKEILREAKKITGAPVGYIMGFNKNENQLELEVYDGPADLDHDLTQQVDEGVIGQAVKDRQSVRIDAELPEWNDLYKGGFPGVKSVLAVPLLNNDDSTVRRVLNLEAYENGGFSEKDKDALDNLAMQAITAINIVNLSDNVAWQVSALQSLNEITARINEVTARIQDPEHKLDTALRLLLTGVTAEEGLKYSRAMLLLVDKTGRFLEGKMAIGPQRWEDATPVWNGLKEKKKEKGDLMFNWLLERAEAFSANLEKGGEDHPLSQRIREYHVSIEPRKGALPLCVSTGEMRINDGEPDTFRSFLEDGIDAPNLGFPFVCVPLKGKDSTIGVLVVDDCFHNDKRKFDDKQRELLLAYANVIARTVETAQLSSRLSSEQNLTTWMESTRVIAHILADSVSLIAGFTSGLNHKVREDTEMFTMALRADLNGEREKELEESVKTFVGKKGISDLALELRERVGAAQDIVNDFLEAAKPLELQLKETELATVMNDLRKNIRVFKDCEITINEISGPIKLYCDSEKLNAAFMELISNAERIMKEKHCLTRAVTITASREQVATGQSPSIRITVTDTGPKIREEYIERIFRPGFTTKHNGIGYGLVRVKGIVDGHRGSIQMERVEGGGARFVISLPIIRDSI
jgi:GAF domain-containing protein